MWRLQDPAASEQTITTSCTMNNYMLVFLLLVSCLGFGESQSPGVQIRVLQNGLHRASQVGVDLLASKVTNQNLPDVGGGSDDLEWELTAIKITSFTKPDTQVAVSPSHGFTWTLFNAALTINANWRYKYTPSFFSISDSGSLMATTSGVSLSISIKLGVDSSGHPTSYTTQCTSHVGHLDINISGTLFSAVYNLLINLFEGKIKGEAADELCKAAREAINDDLNEELAEVDLMEDIDKTMVLDYRLTGQPVFGDGFINFLLRGEFHSRTDRQPFPSTPSPFTPPGNMAARMVNIWGSDYVINSYAYTAYIQELLQYNLEGKKVPTSALRTSCAANLLCIGTLFPEVEEKFPDMKADVSLKATKPPQVHTKPSGISLSLDGDLALQIQKPDGTMVPIFKLAMSLNMSVHVRIEGNTLHGNVTSFEPAVKVESTILTNAHEVSFQALFNFLVKKVVVESLDELGQKGVDIPHIKNTRFTNTILLLREGGLFFATDGEWDPTPPTIHPPTTPPTTPPPEITRPEFFSITPRPTTSTTLPTENTQPPHPTTSPDLLPETSRPHHFSVTQHPTSSPQPDLNSLPPDSGSNTTDSHQINNHNPLSCSWSFVLSMMSVIIFLMHL